MVPKLSGLGKGLDAIFMENYTDNQNSPTLLDISEIEPNKSQPRKSFNEESLAKLADSISKYGLLQPLLVRPQAGGGYQIVAGERRWRACRKAGITEIPVTIRELTDLEVAQVALIENLQRQDLNPVEEATAYRLLLDKFNLSQEDIALAMGKSRSAISNLVRILALPKEVLHMIEVGFLSSGHARTLLSLKKLNRATAIAQVAVKKGLSVRELEKLCKRENDLALNMQTPKKQETTLPFYEEAEKELKSHIPNYKTRINSKKSGKGTLEIDFNDETELRAILQTVFNVQF